MSSVPTARSVLLATALSAMLVPSAYAQAPTLAPHRAVYELKLDDRRASGGLDQARGRILFETTGNRCEGFTTNFRQVVELTMNGNRVVMDARTAHFEEGDGSGFRFTSAPPRTARPIWRPTAAPIAPRTPWRCAAQATRGDIQPRPCRHFPRPSTFFAWSRRARGPHHPRGQGL